VNLTALLSVSVILFSVIDMLGNIPVLVSMRKEGVSFTPSVVTSFATIIMIAFLFFGSSILGLFGIEISSFALAGSVVMLFIGIEMILGIKLFKEEAGEVSSGSIVPIAFPLLAGAGTLTTIISLKAEFDTASIFGGIIVNAVIIFVLLRSIAWIAAKMTPQTATTLRKVFGIILLAIAIQIAKTNI